VEGKIKRLIEWSKGRKTGPLSLEIWPTNRCNLKCIMCGTWASRRKAEKKGIIFNVEEEKKRELPDEIWLKIVKDAIRLNVKEFLITGGGEPLVRKETTLKLMENIKQHETFGMLNTNGTLFSSQDIRRVISFNWDMIIFSVDASNAKIHDLIRGVFGTFDKVKRVLMEFKKEKKKARTEKPKIVFNTVVLNKNFESLPSLVKFASSVGCESITFIPLIIFDEFVGRFRISERQTSRLKEIFEKVEKLSRKLDVYTNAKDLLNFQENGEPDEMIRREVLTSPANFASAACYEPFLHLLITPDGEATSCCMLAGKGIKVDWLSSSLREIWFGEWFEKLRRQFLEKKLPAECGNCVFSQFMRNRQLRESLQKHLE